MLCCQRREPHQEREAADPGHHVRLKQESAQRREAADPGHDARLQQQREAAAREMAERLGVTERLGTVARLQEQYERGRTAASETTLLGPSVDGMCRICLYKSHPKGATCGRCAACCKEVQRLGGMTCSKHPRRP